MCGGSRGTNSLNTMRNTEPAIGEIESDEFQITKRYVCFFVSGFGTKMGADVEPYDSGLDVDIPSGGGGAKYPNKDGTHRQCLDLQSHIGQNAKILLGDASDGGGYAWGQWDYFTCEDTDLSCTVGGYGNSCGLI